MYIIMQLLDKIQEFTSIHVYAIASSSDNAHMPQGLHTTMEFILRVPGID